jgi:RNA polymerase sigma-70 factor (ECF subfamily)
MTESLQAQPPLLPSVARGDVAAFEALYDRYSGLLYALLLRMLGSPEDAQEVLQEAFVKAWNDARMFDSARGSEVAWLISITRSRGIDRIRSRKIRYERESDAGREISIRTTSVDTATGSHELILAQERAAVRAALVELPEAQRLALEMAYFDGLSQTQIAEKLGEPLGTIKTRMQLGMKKLRDRLKSTLGR